FGQCLEFRRVLFRSIASILAGKKIPIYGDGQHIRQWLWVEDHVDGLFGLLKSDHPPGEVFHIAGSQECTNYALASKLLSFMKPGKDSSEHIELIPDHNIRPTHDRRYAISGDKLYKATGWQPKVSL